MKYRESGMPQEEMWNSFFHPEDILDRMEVNESVRYLLDIGCGYGTFLIPASKIVRKKVIGLDIDEEMISTCQNKVEEERLLNIELLLGDFSQDSTKKALSEYEGNLDYITLFNILHCENPNHLLQTAYRLLNKNGKIGVIHWKYENTPRGPSMDIRPTPDKICEWALKEGFLLVMQVDLKPYHYGLIFHK